MPVSPVYTPGTHQMAKIKAAMPAMPTRSPTMPLPVPVQGGVYNPGPGNLPTSQEMFRAAELGQRNGTIAPMGSVSTQQPVVTSGGPPRAPTTGFNVAPAPSPGINSPGIQALVQALMRQQGGNGQPPATGATPQYNMSGPNAQPNLGNMGLDIFNIKAKQAAALAAMQPPAPPPAAAPPPMPPADWARQFFGSGMGSPSYGPGNAMAKLNGFAQQNPHGVQRWADAGHVPAPTMMPQQRRMGASGR